jgi:hypothetical protein
MKKNLNLTLSLISFLYFATLILISVKSIELSNFAEAFFEFSTIPFIVLVFVLTILGIKTWKAENWSISSSSFITVAILLFTICFLIAATVFNI